MVSIIQFKEDNLVGFQIQHYIDEAGLRTIVHEMDEKASGHHGNVCLYFEFLNFGGWDSVQSFFDMLKLKFNSWNKIAKYTIVTDKDWVEKQSRLANFLAPHFEAKAFGTAEKEKALAWLSQPVPDTQAKGVAVLEAMPSHVVGLAAIRELTSSDYNTIDHLLEEQAQKRDDLRLYLEILHQNENAPATVWEGLKQGVKYYSKFSKVAIAGHEEWLQLNSRTGDALPSGMHVKFFNLHERDTAIDWLR